MKISNHYTENSSRMKKSVLSGYYKLIYLLVIAGMIGLIASCDTTSDTDRVPEIDGVRYVHPDSAAAKQMDLVGPGEMFIIVGKNLNSTKRAFFNGIEAGFNPTLVTNTHMVIRVPGDMPFGIMDPGADEMNTIRLVATGGETVYSFPILPSPPVITRVNKEFARAGENLRLEGRFLYLVEKVTFPGGITVNDPNAIRTTANGSWLEVVVPDDVTDVAGHVNVTTLAGTTINTHRNMFQDKRGIFINYDDKNPYWHWAGSANPSTPNVRDDASGIQPLDGNYLHVLEQSSGTLGPGSWWNENVLVMHVGWQGLTWPDIPVDTPTSELVLRFEVSTPHDKFNSGAFKMGFGGLTEPEVQTWYAPFYVDGKNNVPLVTNGWETVTIPLTAFNMNEAVPVNYSGFIRDTFQFFWINPGATDGTYPGVLVEELNIAFDNFRIVQAFEELP